MAAFDPATLDRWRALAIVDRDGTTVGTIREFYLDRETGHPTWALVETGLFGTTQAFVPLVHVVEISDGLQVPYEKRHIKDAPRVDLHDELTPDEEAALLAHYGVDYEPAAETSPGADEDAWSVPAEPGSAAPDESAGPVPAEPGSSEPGEAADAGAVAGEPPGPVAVEDAPGPVATEPEPAGPPEGEAESAPTDAPETPSGEHRPGEADDGRDAPDPDTVTAGIPDEPGTTEPDEADRVGPEGTRFESVDRDDAGPRVGRQDGAPDPDAPPAAGPEPEAAGFEPDRFRSAPAGSDQFGAVAADPDIGRTARVEPGLPGSTAASPYGDAATIDKGAGPAEPMEEPLQAPDEAGWAPGSAASFEEQVPVDAPAGTSDRWREAKLAAERDRIARASAAQPEERSPLERARRRLERLVGVGQEPPDPDDISPADREAAERARRARLGLDDQDHRQR
jgi:hypothetical protein